MRNKVRARAALTRFASLVALALSCCRCTAEPVSRGLLVTSPYAHAAWTRDDPNDVERIARAHRDPADAANAHAVAVALTGRYQQAMSALPVPSSPTQSITRRAVRANVDVIAYWQQRRMFAGSAAVPDPHISLATRAGRTTLSAPGFSRAFERLSETLEVDVAGLRMRLPYDAFREQGETTAMRGDTELTLQSYVGKARTWPNTKLTIGLTALIDRSAFCTPSREARLDAFAGLARRVGPIATTTVLGLPANTGVCPGPCLEGGDAWLRTGFNLLLHEAWNPSLEVRAAAFFVDREHVDIVGSVAPGLRIMLDDRDAWRFDGMQISTFAHVNGVRAMRSEWEAKLSYRWW